MSQPQSQTNEALFTTIPIKDIYDLAQQEHNSKCFDCNSSPANWVCINNGIYLCATCAGEHRSYGSIISCIKSLILDKFNEYQMELLKIAGNKRLQDLLQEYKVEYHDMDKLMLYSSKLLEYYRDVLYNKLTGKKEPEKLQQNYAMEIMDNFRVVVRPPVNKVTYRKEEENCEEGKKDEERKEDNQIENKEKEDNDDGNNNENDDEENNEEEKKKEKGCGLQ